MRRAVTTLVVAAALVPAAGGGGASSPPPPPVQTFVVPTGRAPCGLAGRAGSLWVGVYEAGTLLRVDERGRIVRRIPVGRYACRVALDARHAWVTRDNANEVVRVDRRTGARLRVALGAMPFDVLHAHGFVWATGWDVGTLTKIDAAHGSVLETLAIGERPTGLAACGGTIWIGHGRGARRITSVDPATLAVRTARVTATPEWPNCIHGELWVTAPGAVLRLDPRTGRTLSRLRFGATLADAALGPDGHVWVTDKQQSVVFRVSGDGRSVVDSFAAGPGAFAVERIDRSMWVTSFAGSDVRRFDP